MSPLLWHILPSAGGECGVFCMPWEPITVKCHFLIFVFSSWRVRPILSVIPTSTLHIHVSAILLHVYGCCVITLHQISFGYWGLSFSSKKPHSLWLLAQDSVTYAGWDWFENWHVLWCPGMSITSIKGWGEILTRCNFFGSLYLPI